jgi:hypothetical protein
MWRFGEQFRLPDMVASATFIVGDRAAAAADPHCTVIRGLRPSRQPDVNDGRKLTPYRRSKVDPLLAC